MVILEDGVHPISESIQCQDWLKWEAGPAQPGRSQVHGDGTSPDPVAGALPDDYRLLPQHVRRRPQESVRPLLRGSQGSYGTAKMKRKRGLLSRLLNPFA